MTKTVFILSACLLPAGVALAQSPCTPITTIPYTIATAGTYCLTADLPVTNVNLSYGILIASDNVTINLQGHTLDGGSLGPGNSTTGIYSLDRANIHIFGGTVRGFNQGIVLDTDNPAASHDLLVENMLIDQSKYRGMRIDGNHTIVRDNLIRDTGYNTTGEHPDGLVTCGNGGSDGVVYNNVVLNVVGDAPDGMELYCFGASAIGNRVINSDKGGLEMRPGSFCKDNIVEYSVRFVWNLSADPAEACTFVGNTNYAWP
jgi:hypothetical protein